MLDPHNNIFKRAGSSRGNSRGDSRGDSGSDTGGSLPSSPIPGKRRKSRAQFSSPIKENPLNMQGAPSPDISASQLADSLDSRGGLRFDLDGTIVAPGELTILKRLLFR